MRDPRSNDFNGCKPIEYLCYFLLTYMLISLKSCQAKHGLHLKSTCCHIDMSNQFLQALVAAHKQKTVWGAEEKKYLQKSAMHQSRFKLCSNRERKMANTLFYQNTHYLYFSQIFQRCLLAT